MSELPLTTSRDAENGDRPRDGTGLCLSGGGYRAMLFHTGALWRLYEVDLLRNVRRISSVSGGSIIAGVLALNWNRLSFDPSRLKSDFVPLVVAPVRSFASHTIDVGAVLKGLLLPGRASSRIARAYNRYLFHGVTLQNLPDQPRFVINATNLQSGVLCRFSKPFMWDYRVGMIANPNVPLATAVAASSAFPPFLSPLVLKFMNSDFVPDTGNDLQREPFTTRMVLTDGGVYDNLGLETVWKNYKTVLVSDGGGGFSPKEKPAGDWLLQSYRVLNVIDNQVRSLRKHQVVESYVSGTRTGAYWGIRTHIDHYPQPGPLKCPYDHTIKLAETPTRLKRLDDKLQERLINWGYAVCDAAVRSHVLPNPGKPEFPYPDVEV